MLSPFLATVPYAFQILAALAHVTSTLTASSEYRLSSSASAPVTNTNASGSLGRSMQYRR
jgi:hypothetical protein